MATVSVRQKLDRIGKRRAAHQAREDKLAEDTEKVLAEAVEEGVPVTEAAKRTGLHRTTLYRVYMPEQ